MRLKTVAIIGTNGIPAKYGGFETLAENIVRQLNSCYNFIVYCSNKNNDSLWASENGNVKLIRVPLDANGAQAVLYDIITTIHAWFKADTLLVLGPAAGFFLFLNALFRKNVIVNHGGLNEWEREKLTWLQKKWAKYNHKIAARYSDINITDNYQYKKSLKDNFGTESIVIRYGGDHVTKIPISKNDLFLKYPFINKKYAVSISRAQVDNNLHLVLKSFETFLSFPLVLISNWNVSDYGRELYKKYKTFENIIVLDAIYDKYELDFLRGNAYVYIHSHSRCGTAPSLVEAMSLNLPIISYDVPANRETTQNKAIFFKKEKELIELLSNINEDDFMNSSNSLYELASSEYTWAHVSSQYDKDFESKIEKKLG